MSKTADLIVRSQKHITGSVTTTSALTIADGFSDACRAGEPIPVWAMALRNLAGKVRFYREVEGVDVMEDTRTKRKATEAKQDHVRDCPCRSCFNARKAAEAERKSDER